ncbi:DUF642 domain-containing protein [Bowmanella denitrificans]|uniref:DUF642 domain-containing protein n=1 Tax=Bowmanella denitrificans TaxID=366582 RepID=UPI000C9B2380|nr:DUF642 domain-containing protein [Bowmanella denitrificans]
MKSALRVLVMFSALVVAQVAEANLIVNGGFEQPDVAHNSWKWFSSSQVDGWQGSNLEIWDHYNGFTAAEGQQHAELNAHAGSGGAFSIFQTFETEIGAVYDLSFFYAARSSNDEAFRLNLTSGAQDIFNQLFDDHLVRQWRQFSMTFTAIAQSTTLRFTSVAPYAGTVGNFLDNVVVLKQPLLPLTGPQQPQSAQPAQVPEPAGILLTALGLLFVASGRMFVSRCK